MGAVPLARGKIAKACGGLSLLATVVRLGFTLTAEKRGNL